MKYREGRLGRVFVLKFEHGEDFQKEVSDFCRKESVRCGQVQFLGAIKESEVVVGPRKPVIPPEPIWKKFNDGREVVGYGTIFWDENEPRVHLHGVFSRRDNSFIGCIRKKSEVYLIIEAVIIEITDVDIKRVYNEKLKLTVLEIM